MAELFCSSFPSSLGKVCLASTNKGLCWLTIDFANKIDDLPHYLEAQYKRITIPAEHKNHNIREQLENYLKGALTEFSCSIDFITGTPFQRRVWQETIKIPYGQVVTYKEIAHRVGRPKAFRAVGQALGANPVAIVIPCHRVISSNNSLCGYGLGLNLKRRLLTLEGAFA